MRKMFSVILALLMALSLMGAAFAEADTTAQATAIIDNYIDRTQPQELTIGSPTELSGCFFTDMWGNNTSDIDIRTAIHGYSTAAWSRNGNIIINPTVVTSQKAVLDSAGNKTYTFELAQDLQYNDGTPITAKDFVFSVLLLTAPQMTDFGSVPTTYSHLIGYDAFREGKPFSGVRLLDEYAFSITINKANLPYYFELAMIDVTPYPMGVIAPECGVADDGDGAYLTGPFTKELLEQTVMNPETGYLYHPQVTSGAYTLASYDANTHVATLIRNAHFKGNYEGQKPYIEKVTFRRADSATAVDAIAQKELDVINKVSEGDAIRNAMDSVGTTLASVSYPRSGLSFVSFACEMGATQSEKVRSAIAMSIDVPTLIQQFAAGYAMPVYGYYGLGQWMAVQYPEELTQLATHEFDLNAAAQLLESDGWNLDSEGNAYSDETGGTRYRRTDDGALEELVIKWAKAEGTTLTDLLDTMLTQNFQEIGIRLDATVMPFSDMLRHYYRQTDRTYNMFSIATNFSMIFDPYFTYNTGEEYQGVFNTTGIADEKLMELAKSMRETEEGDNDGYFSKWLAFQKRWVELMPQAPLFSNVYFDFTRSDLQNYYPNSHYSWAAAVLYAYIGQPLPVENSEATEAP